HESGGGRASSASRVRDSAEGPAPGKLPPCAVGSETRLLVRRKVANEGIIRSNSSSVWLGLLAISLAGRTVTGVGTSRIGRGARVAVITTSPPSGSGVRGVFTGSDAEAASGADSSCAGKLVSAANGADAKPASADIQAADLASFHRPAQIPAT